MTIHYAGTEKVHFDSTNWASTNDTAYFDSNFVRAAQLVGPDAWAHAYLPTPLSPSEGEGVWVSVRYGTMINRPNTYLTRDFIVGLDEAGSWVFTIKCNGDFRTTLRDTSNNVYENQTWKYVQRYGVKFNICLNYYQDGTTLRIRMYLEGALVGQTELENTEGRSIARIAFRGPSNYGSDTYGISEVIVADEYIVGARLKQLYPTSNGDNSGWGGSYADIDETDSDEVSISATTENTESTFAHNKTLTPNIKDLVLAARASVETDASFLGVIRSSGVSDVSQFKYPPAHSACQFANWSSDPFSNGAFVPSSVAGLQFGVRR